MRNTFWFFVLVFVFSAGFKTACGQETQSKAQHQYVVAPRDLAISVVAAQPESPLDFVDTQALISVGSRLWLPGFRLHNHGTKPIRSFTVASAGSNEWTWTATNSSDYFLPGQIKAIEENNRDEIVPLTDALRDELKLSGPMKGIMVLLVVSVEYVDGSVFKETGYESLEYYLGVVRGAVSDPRCKPKSSSQVKTTVKPGTPNSVTH
jgi:hypothetical protein